MIQVRGKPWFIVQAESELPNLFGSDLVMDFETTSRDSSKTSLNPWHGCWTAGIAVKSDQSNSCFYIPVEHDKALYGSWNLDKDTVRRWLKVTLARFKSWTNANVKYDVHVLYNDFGLDVCRGPLELELRDITTLAKLVESDRTYKGGYGLDKLSQWLLGVDITPYESALQPYLRNFNKDYGKIPPDILGVYANNDVDATALCALALDMRLPAETKALWETEKKCTKILAKIERRGLKISMRDVVRSSCENQLRMLVLENRLHDLTGRWLNVSSSKDMYDYVCNTLGLPVMRWTNEDSEDELEMNPSFNKHALRDYLLCADAPKEFFETALELRERRTFQSIFLDPYVEKNVDGVLHPTVNQCVNTGRTSCSEPNLQQLNKLAKSLVVPREGNTILRWDYCNIEYRYITHYIQAIPLIKRFLEDPDADFHQVVADECSFDRDVAKTINFLSAYGGGLDKLIKQLSSFASVMKTVLGTLSNSPEYQAAPSDRQNLILRNAVEKHSKEIYQAYHRRMPTLRATSKRAENLCKQRGYVQNLFGRRRHLPPEFAYRAFNAVCQGAGADLMKAKMVQMDEHLEPLYSRYGIESTCPPVHDEYLLEGPSEILEDPRFIRDATAIMEDTKTPVEGRSIAIAIPVRTDYGFSRVSWKDASSKERKQKLPVSELNNAEHFTWLHNLGGQ